MTSLSGVPAAAQRFIQGDELQERGGVAGKERLFGGDQLLLAADQVEDVDEAADIPLIGELDEPRVVVAVVGKLAAGGDIFAVGDERALGLLEGA